MKNSRKQSQKQVKIQSSRIASILKKTKLWQKVVIATVVLLGLSAIAFAMGGIFSVKSDTPHFECVAVSPTPATFDTDVSSEITGAENIPDVNNNRELNAPGELIILYNQISGQYAPAIRMDATDEDIASNIKISPQIAGRWSRRGPDTLVFRPKSNWPADEKFSVKINKKIINPDIRVKSDHITFKTAPLVANADSFNTYPTTEKKSVVGVAVISFNYPVETKSFHDRAKMRLNGDQIDFTAKFDRFHRTVVITTAPIKVTNDTQTLRLKINRIPAATDDAQSAKITANTTIESADNIFKISGLETTVADDTSGLPQQLLLIDMTSAAARDVKWDKYVDLYLLPTHRNSTEDKQTPHKWSVDEITPDVIKQSKKLALTPVEFENPRGVYRYAMTYDVSENNDRFIYASVKNGIPAAAGFETLHGLARVMRVPYPARSVKIAGSGALLTLGGDKKLGLTARGGADAAYVNLYKVKSTEINHLISQTYNIFGDMEFKSWSFDAYDMSVVFKKRIGFSDTSMKTVNYASVDLGDYLDRTHGDKTGIFIVQTGPSQSAADYSDRRLILLTDLGIVRKVNLDRSSTVFVAGLSTSAPAADTEIYVLGRNGNSVWAGRTNEMGRADIPELPWNEYKNEKAPVAIVVRRGDDVSFIPYDSAYDRRVEYSKFNVDGTYASAATSLNAFLFSDRGIYRPGETVVIGGIVKNKSFKSLPGIPVKLEIRNARGRIVFEKTFSLAADGMFDIKYSVGENAPTGEYNFQLFSLNAKNKPQDILGNASFRVEEFVPDTLKINASIIGADDTGWLAPKSMAASVSLQNMFATPAADKRITARMILTPTPFEFKEFPGYKFTDNFISGAGMAANAAAKTITREYDDITTDSDGNAQWQLNIDDAIADNATYTMTLIVQGFEGGSGRGVQTTVRNRASNAKYLVGWHANSDLSYINRGAARNVNLVAIDHTATRTTAADMTMQLIRRENLTSLIKDGAGYYKYQTVTRDKTVARENISIPAGGLDINLDTATPGTYYLQILNSAGTIMSNIEYFVAGDENTAMATDTRAELQIKLNAATYAPGDDISVGITSPYAGYGLITIERDKVYAFKWFRTSTTNSVQHITVPNGFEGTGYVNVSFVRDINSRDIFTTPYTYAVAPFMADTARRTIDIRLTTPRILSNDKLTVKYETNRDARLMIFAINQGILQVARHQIPNPIAHFFKKAALQVETYQILSLILPEYKILREFAKTGGGDYDDMGDGNGALSNPFARRAEKSVAFYSEIINARADTPGTVTFDIPNSFNGALRVFAVAAGDGGIGAADTTVTVQHPVIIGINAPAFAAPGDTFDIGVVTTNLTDDKNTQSFDIAAKTTGDVHLKTNNTRMDIPNGTEKLWTISAAAGNNPAPAEISITARANDFSTTAKTEISIRPTAPFTTEIQTGILNTKKTTIRPVSTDMYPQQASRRLYVSYGADALVRPLVEYLAHYEWNCTEQLVSRAIPYAVIGQNDMMGITYDAATKQINDTIATLKNRQNDDGSFALWAGGNTGRNNESDADTAYLTAYAALFLDLARNNGYDIPRDMLGRAVDYLRTYAGTNIRDARDAAAHAFAIYVITTNEYITTAYIGQFEEWANANMKNWQSQIMGQYIAAAYSIMHQDDRANALASKYKSAAATAPGDMFNNPIANNALRQYLATKYFGMAAATPNAEQIKYINSGAYSSFTAAALILGYSNNIGRANNVADAINVIADGTPIAAASNTGAFSAEIPMTAKKIEITCPECGTSTNLFWTITQSGFPKTVAATSNGIDISREYYDMDGNRIDHAKIGDQITVKIFVRTRGDVTRIENAVIADMLPGGFIADTETLSGEYEYATVREDRVVIYTDVTRSASEYSYTARAGAAGTFAIPAIRAIDMYNPTIRAVGAGGTFTVTNGTDN